MVKKIVKAHGNDPTELLQILRRVQAEYRHIPQRAVELVATQLGISHGQVQGVSEFYSFLSTTPRGQYDIFLSDCIIDHLQGEPAVMAQLCNRLGVKPGQTRADGRVSVDHASCSGLCDQGPSGLVNGYPLTRLTLPRIDQIADLIERGAPLATWPQEFFAIADNLHKTGLILDPPLVPGKALEKAFATGLDGTLAEIGKSGLRGRGGAGFKTALKWKFCREEAGNRYVVCNADEGEPGTFKDRVLLQSHAHQVFEGMTLAAAIVDARQGYLYLRGEYLYLCEPLNRILEERRRLGLLGRKILGHKGFDFDIRLHLGAGAYICGEESALIESLEGKRGVPRNRPPYPVTQGYLGRPTVVNNVETFAAAAKIALNGGDWFAAVGTEKSKGSKILSISGDCARPGIYEYPFGTKIARILEDCGADQVIGVQIGGPSGTFIAPREFDRKLAFEDLATGGSFMIFNENRDVLAIARNFSHFFAHESCGFCTPCRVGTSLLKNCLDKICDGHGTAADLVELTELSRLIKTASHCGLGQTAANPVLSTLERFPHLYERRLREISFQPGFDLDGELEVARRLTGRDDAYAHLTQEE